MKNTFLDRYEAKVIGHIGVDSGLVWIGDPCYVIHSEGKFNALKSNWIEFCSNIKNKTYNSLEYNHGHEGLGIVTRTPGGDVYYPVIGFFELDNDIPSIIAIDFENTILNDNE